MLRSSKKYREIKRKSKLSRAKQLEEQLDQQMPEAKTKRQEEQPKLKEVKNDSKTIHKY